jgi:threonyl-tRNA synthetase
MLHRVVLGSMERFMAVLIEHYGGAFPSWLAPIQATVLTISERSEPYGLGVYDELLARGVRVEKDVRNESLRLKIREAQLQKIPYMLVVGDKEADQRGVSPRTRSGKDLGMMEVERFVAMLRDECPVTTGWEPTQNLNPETPRR